MNLQLTDKTALVTGASQGIGRAIAKGLAAEGAQTCIVARPSPVPADGRSANVSRGLAAAINCRQRIADLLLF